MCSQLAWASRKIASGITNFLFRTRKATPKLTLLVDTSTYERSTEDNFAYLQPQHQRNATVYLLLNEVRQCT